MTREELEETIDYFITKRVNDALKQARHEAPERMKMAIEDAFMRLAHGECPDDLENPHVGRLAIAQKMLYHPGYFTFDEEVENETDASGDS